MLLERRTEDLKTQKSESSFLGLSALACPTGFDKNPRKF